MAYAPYSSQILLIASFEDRDIETMADAMRRSGHTGEACADDCDTRPAQTGMRRWRFWGEKLVEEPLDPRKKPEDRMEVHGIISYLPIHLLELQQEASTLLKAK